MNNKCRDLLLQEHCKKLFILIDSFWDEIIDVNFDLKWFFKVRNYIEKLQRKLQETKLQKLALARFREHSSHFKFKVDFTLFCDNIHNILTLNESNNSENEHGEFFQASQNNIT